MFVSHERICVRNDANSFIDRPYLILSRRKYAHRAADDRHDTGFDIAFRLDMCHRA